MNITNSLIKDIVNISEDAGSAIMDIYGRSESSASEGVSYKDDGSPLTEADTASNAVIMDGLLALTPRFPVLSEESVEIPFEERSTWESFWLVDPLDGTKEFIRRSGEFTVNIALIESGRPVLGVVYVPASGVLYYGAEGIGAFKSEGSSFDGAIAIPPLSSVTAREIPRVVASRMHRGEELEDFLTRIGRHEPVSMGSSLKFCLVAEGLADLYPRFGPTMEWDTGAADAVVRASGGLVANLNGDALKYNKPDLHNPAFMVTGADSPFPWQEFL